MNGYGKTQEFKKPSFKLAALALLSVIFSLVLCIMIFKTVSIQVGRVEHS